MPMATKIRIISESDLERKRALARLMDEEEAIAEAYYTKKAAAYQ